MTKLILLFKGHIDSKLSMARVMLWILFVFMLTDEWRTEGRVLYQWEFIFMSMLTYILGGKYMFGKFIDQNKKSPRHHRSEYEEAEDNEQDLNR